MRKLNPLHLLLAVIVAVMTVACANMGRPEGGPRDETPPAYVSSNPAMGQLRVKGNKVTVTFDENIALDDAMNKIVVSPAQRTTPAISIVGRRVTVELRDTLIPNTTYTIDFSDAIKDLNEGNVLDGLALDFATGDSIDTLRISGMVFEARTLEPAQGMLVGVYSNLSDTALTTLPLERITKTNQLGQFTLRNLKEGVYRIFAINDVNRDYHWDRSEDIAFYDVTVSPTSEPMTVTDTLVSASGERDSMVTRGATRFLPDDVLLTWFNEGYSAQYLKDYKRPALNQITLNFGAKADSLPRMRLVNTHRAGDDISLWTSLDASAGLDSLTYWITDSTLSDLDSLFIETRYLRTDTLGELSEKTDTLKFLLRGNLTKKRRTQEAEKAAERRAKELADIEKRNESIRERNIKLRAEGEDTTEWLRPEAPEIKYLDFKLSGSSSQDLNKPMVFKSPTPIASIDSTGVRMEMEVDSVWYPVAAPRLTRAEPLRPMVYVAPYEWEEATKYRITIDSAAVTDVFGKHNKQIQQELNTKARAEYSTLSFNLSGLDGRKAVVELLQSDKPVITTPAKGENVLIEYINPGAYYARLFIDANGDGKWTTGSVADSIQPEEVYYYPRKINLKKNWDMEQDWNINELPVDMQKPQDIKTNKPKRKKGERDETTPEEEEEDEFFDDPFMRDATRNNGLGGSTRGTGVRRGSNNPYL